MVTHAHGGLLEDYILDPGRWGHRMIRADLTVAREERGRDLQTINERIFDDEDFLNSLRECIAELEICYQPRTSRWAPFWEECKRQVVAMCHARSQALRKKQDERVTFVKTLLTTVRKRIDSGTADATDFAEEEDLKTELRDTHRHNFSLSTCLEKRAYTMGQKHDINTAAFHRQWTPRNAGQWVHEIMTADWSDPSDPQNIGNPLTSAKDIADGFTDYYEPLFAKKVVSKTCKRMALDTLRTGDRVLPDTAAACNAPITIPDVADTCSYLPTGKSPGPDRLPNKFYKVMSAVIAPILTEVLNEARRLGKLPPTMMEGIISILYKKKRRDDPRNYRPITLLNGDYKIFTRILTQRMNKAVVQFVSDDQNGFVPNAFIAENLLRIQMIQAYLDEEDQEGLFIFLDMEKALIGIRPLQLGIHPRRSRCSRLRRRLYRLHQARILKRPPAQATDASERIPREKIRARIWSGARVSHFAPAFPNYSGAPRQTHKPEQKNKGGNHGRPPAQDLPICRR